MSTRRYPIDFETVEKGDVIPADRVERVLGIKRDSPAYRMALLGLKTQVRRELWRLGKRFTLRTHKGGLVVLTDAMASLHNHSTTRNALRMAIRAHVQNLAVSVEALTADQLRQHERFVEVDGRTIQAIAGVRPRLVPEPVRREVPGLPAPM